MKIESVRIKNLRSFEDQTISFNPYTCILGPNGGGKSTVFTALNIFFRYSQDVATDVSLLDDEDFHNKNTSDPIEIIVTFSDLSTEAQSDFSDYCRQGKLIVSARATWNVGIRKAEVKQFGQRLAIADFSPFFRAEGDNAKVEDLKKHYNVIKAKYTALPAPGTKAAMIEALRDYENKHPQECTLIPSEDQFYGVSKGKNLLEKYLQWIFVPAVKDATSEQIESRRTALGQILERTVRAKLSFTEPLKEIREKAESAYTQMLAEREKELEELSTSLTEKFQDWAHPEATVRLKWRNEGQPVKLNDPLAEMLAGEGAFEGQIARFGHGLQRSLLLTLLQELATADSKLNPTLILACEEPELFQHPPQVRHLASVLHELTDGGAQVFICTHSPLFVRGNGFEDIRLIRKSSGNQASESASVQFSEIAELVGKARGEKPLPPQGSAMKIAQALQPSLNEMFFVSALILVEGLEDAAYINSYMVLTDRWEEFRRLGCHIVAAGGKSSLIQPVAIARLLRLPTFLIFDCDTDKCDREDRRKMHERDNKALMFLCDTTTNPLPNDHVWLPNATFWKEEIGSALKADIGETEWINLCEQVRNELKVQSVPDLHKNSEFITALLGSAWDKGIRFGTLDKLCDAIIQFARDSREKSISAASGS